MLDALILAYSDDEKKMRAALATIGFGDFPYAQVLGDVRRLRPMLRGTV